MNERIRSLFHDISEDAIFLDTCLGCEYKPLIRDLVVLRGVVACRGESVEAVVIIDDNRVFFVVWHLVAMD